MGMVNLAVGRMMSQKEVFADFVNGIFYDGKQVLQSERLEHITTHRGYAAKREDGKKKAVEYDGDVRMKADFGTYSVIFADENQDLTHYAMPLRCMIYEVEEYREQWYKMKDSHQKARELYTGEERLSGMTCEDRFAPVVCFVFFTGKAWKGPLDLYGMLDFGGEENAEFWKQYIPNYRMNLVRISDIKNPDVFHTSLRHVFGLVQYRNDKNGFRKYMKEHREELDKIGGIAADAILAILGESKRIMIKHDGEEGKMCKALDDWIAEERMEGRRLGRAEGKLEGKLESARTIAGNLFKMGFAEQETAKVCDVPLETMTEWYVEWAMDM